MSFPGFILAVFVAAIARASQRTLALHDCMVKTTHILNLRESPDGAVVRLLPWNVTLTAFQRTPLWFYVDYHGERGWISAAYVIPQGECS